MKLRNRLNHLFDNEHGNKLETNRNMAAGLDRPHREEQAKVATAKIR